VKVELPPIAKISVPVPFQKTPAATQLNDGDPMVPDVPGKPRATRYRDEFPSPYAGKRCAVRGCRTAVSWQELSLADADARRAATPEWESPQNALTAQLESAVARARQVAVQVTDTSRYYCSEHWIQHQEDVRKAVEAKRAATFTDPLSKPLHELDYTTAVIELPDDPAFIFVSDARGNRIKLPVSMLGHVRFWKRSGIAYPIPGTVVRA
jgi:hypothetical protein